VDTATRSVFPTVGVARVRVRRLAYPREPVGPTLLCLGVAARWSAWCWPEARRGGQRSPCCSVSATGRDGIRWRQRASRSAGFSPRADEAKRPRRWQVGRPLRGEAPHRGLSRAARTPGLAGRRGRDLRARARHSSVARHRETAAKTGGRAMDVDRPARLCPKRDAGHGNGRRGP